jgi:phosphoribosylformylglycinamidine (FGAM) synthase-like enzyme
LNNEYQMGETSIAIPPTLLISAIGIMDDVSQAISMDAKQADDLIYILGDTKDEMGGSHYYDIYGFQGNILPKVDAHAGKKLMNALTNAISRGLVKACHDCSEGGIGVAAAEMAFAGGLGMTINLSRVPSSDNLNRNDKLLFSESNSRFILEVPLDRQQEFEKLLKENHFGLIGKTTSDPSFRVIGLNGKNIVEADIYDLKKAWQKTLAW